MLAIDIETYPTQTGRKLPRPVCLSWCGYHGIQGQGASAVTPPGWGFMRHDDIPGFVETAMRSGEILIGHNVSFDLGCIALEWPWLFEPICRHYEQGLVRCTMAWQQLTDTRLGIGVKRKYGLEVVGPRHGFDCPASEWAERFGELDALPTEQWPREAIWYNVNDSLTAFGVAQCLPWDLPDVAAQSRYAFWLTLSSAYGIATDQARVAQWEGELYRKITELEPALRSAGIVRLDGSTDKGALQARVLASGRARKTAPSKRFPQGQVSTAGIVCRESGDPLLESYADYSEVKAAINRELKLVKAPIVHTRYGFADTGRSTSSSPNLQNMGVTTGVRKCFAPRQGHIYIDSDYSGLESCTLAQCCVALGCGDTLASALRSGVDVHGEIAKDILGSTADKTHPKWYYARQAGKVVNYGCPAGMGPDTLALSAKALYRIDMTPSEAAHYRELWRHRWPDARAYVALMGELVEEYDGMIEHYRSGRLRGRCRFTQACNTLFQGLGADVTKDAGWHLMRAGFTIALFVHDQYLIEVPIRGAEDAAAEVKRIQEERAWDWMPDVGCRTTPKVTMIWEKD